MTGADDASLVKATLGGDHSAFGELARRYRDAAFGIAFHRLGDFEAARDAAQEALVTAYVELPMLRDPSKFGNWLYRIATMAALTQRRRRVTVSIDDSGFAHYPTSELSPDEAVERAEKARRVQEALSALAEADRLAVILHYVDGYSHEEIGGILGTSVSAVKSRVHRAKRRLREEMQSMVESSLKSEVPAIEFTEDLVRLALTKDREQGVASLRHFIPARLEYTDQTREAISRIASELAHEGYSWLFAPPHVPGDSPAMELLKSMGFQAELETHWYERPLSGKLPAVPPLDPGFEVRRLQDADPSQLLAFFQSTIMKDGPVHMDETLIRNNLRDPDMIPEASLAAYRGDAVAALVSAHKVTHENPKFEIGTAVLGWVMHDGAERILEHLLASALRVLKAEGLNLVVKDQLQPKYRRDQEVIEVLKQLGFQYVRSQYVLKLDLSAEARDRSGRRIATGDRPVRKLQPLRFSVLEGDRDPKYAKAFQVRVSDVVGTSPVVAPGEVYIVSGEYTLNEPIVPTLDLACSGTSWGFVNHLSPGTHPFATAASVLEVTPGKEDRLYLHTPGLEGDTVRHAIIKLER